MKLSIIIPFYNDSQGLSVLLKSVFSECIDAEVIVVDDNSDKDIEDYGKIRELYGGKVSFLLNDSGVKGAGAARNVGLSKAMGEWLLFADSDDYFIKGWHEKVAKYFESDYDIVFFDPDSENLATGERGTRHELFSGYVNNYVKNNGDHDAELYMRYFFVVPWSKLIRAKTVRENGIVFDEVMHSNDVLFSVKTGYFAKKIKVDTGKIYCVTEGEDSLTKNVTEEAWAVRHEVFCRWNHFLKEKLGRKDFSFFAKRMKSYERLTEAIGRKCGIKNFMKYLKEYRIYKVPLFRSALHHYRCRVGIFLRKHGIKK